ncbi:hypothetical protein [Actinacidiphila glaucinigra]|uniref:hypothetical protein n=1 Tax=Actinacidiphila glaucinigra TaxID=235986 RepID=UPI002E334872|nr:hypothetical protein [Actinacidiphila glaucinigra]
MDFDTHELCRRPCLHARQAGRSPDREAALEPVLTMTGRATASKLRQAKPDGFALAPILAEPEDIPVFCGQTLCCLMSCCG